MFDKIPSSTKTDLSPQALAEMIRISTWFTLNDPSPTKNGYLKELNFYRQISSEGTYH